VLARFGSAAVARAVAASLRRRRERQRWWRGADRGRRGRRFAAQLRGWGPRRSLRRWRRDARALGRALEARGLGVPLEAARRLARTVLIAASAVPARRDVGPSRDGRALLGGTLDRAG
jgi:hypothetical protein